MLCTRWRFVIQSQPHNAEANKLLGCARRFVLTVDELSLVLHIAGSVKAVCYSTGKAWAMNSYSDAACMTVAETGTGADATTCTALSTGSSISYWAKVQCGGSSISAGTTRSDSTSLLLIFAAVAATAAMKLQ